MTLRLLLAGTALAAAPALAQTAPAATAPATTPTGQAAATTATGASAGVAQGATIYDTQGGTVGTIESVAGDMVVVATQKSKVQLPKSSFASGPKGPVIAMTAAQLDQAAAQAGGGQAAGGATAGGAAAASSQPTVAQGSAVTDTQGGAVGTVSEVDARYATVALTTGGKVRLPVTAFGAGPNGGLRVAMTAAQLQAAGGAASAPAAATGSTDATAAAGASAAVPAKPKGKGH